MGMGRFGGATAGAGFVVAATMAATGMDATGKALSATYDPLMVVWARYVGQVVVTVIVFAPSLRRRLVSNAPRLQIGRSALLACASALFFSAFAIAPLADVAAIGQTAPLLITALAAFVLGERVGPHRWAAVGVGLLGALIVLRPGFEGGLGWAAALSVAGAFAFAAYTIATRAAGSVDPPWTSFCYTGLVGAAAASIAAPFVWSTPAWDDLWLFAAVGLFGSATQALIIFAFQRGEASAIAPVFYAQLIWTALVGWFVFEEAPTLSLAVGAGLIVGAGLYVAHRERLRAAPRQTSADAATR